MCATKARKSLVPGKSFSWNERRNAAGHVAPPRNMRNEIRPPEVDPDPEMGDILDISLDRNRELEREVQELSRQVSVPLPLLYHKRDLHIILKARPRSG